jgi:hypothetical protein
LPRVDGCHIFGRDVERRTRSNLVENVLEDHVREWKRTHGEPVKKWR